MPIKGQANASTRPTFSERRAHRFQDTVKEKNGVASVFEVLPQTDKRGNSMAKAKTRAGQSKSRPEDNAVSKRHVLRCGATPSLISIPYTP